MTRPALALLADLMDKEWPSEGWRRPDDDQPGDRAERAARRLLRDVSRGLGDVALTADNLAIGLDAIERDQQR